MSTQVSGWTTLAEDPPVLVKEYKFGSGSANALAVALPERKWMIMSPPASITPADVEGFSKLGTVAALIENNGLHHLGLGPCRAQFPEAVTYAAPSAAERIRKKGQDFGQLEPLEKLQPLLGNKVALIPVDGAKFGDVCVRVQTEKGTLFYAGDFIANIQTLPKNLLFKLMFKLTDSGPGLKVFGLFFWFFVSDRKAARACLIRELEQNPPTILVPAHGDVVARQEVGPTLISMLR
ncbi:MAG: hypothetical protein ACJ8AT_37395 [Hyalangium sp.]|uniref:hypothetical protein n=1 Tax=Hyalangium sp. TaxID=2028555 RepID=UPI00389AE97A